MSIIVGIPTGNRKDLATDTVQKWLSAGFEVCVLTWDNDTAREMDGFDQIQVIHRKKMEPFGINQNRMMKESGFWDVWICGADDLWPGNATPDMIEDAVNLSGDNMLWVGDGLFNSQPTHPVLPWSFYQEHQTVFDESFFHNFVDTDLYIRMLKENKVSRCMDIMFEHRHHSSGKTKMDKIYRIGEKSFDADRMRFEEKHPFILDQYPIQEIRLEEEVAKKN